MNKKVCFITKESEDDRFEVVFTVLTEGYVQGGVSEKTKDNGDTRLEFMVNRCDLADLRHDVNVLVKAGYSVREVELT